MRYGKFRVHGRFFRDLAPPDGVNLFHGMVVYAVEQSFAADERIYYATHRSFRELDRGELAPEYIATFHAGEIHPTWLETDTHFTGFDAEEITAVYLKAKKETRPMTIEFAQLKDAPPAKARCEFHPHAGNDFMRGQVQSNWRRVLGFAYCAVICTECKQIIGWEKPK